MRCLERDGASSRSHNVILASLGVESPYDFSSINQLKATVTVGGWQFMTRR
jgi:hypothetical protein